MSEKTLGTSFFLKPCIKGVIVGAVSGIIFSAAASVAAYSSPDPDSLVKPLALAAFFAAAIVCGIASAISAGKKPLASLISGTAFVLITTLISFLIPGDGIFKGAAWFLLRLAGIAAAATAGTVFSMSGGKKRSGSRSSRKRRRR